MEEQEKKCHLCHDPWNFGHKCPKRDDLLKKGLCFKCKEPWERNHQCKRGQMNKITYNKESPNKRGRFEGQEHGTLAVIT